MKVTIPYGKEEVSFNVPDKNFCELLEPSAPEKQVLIPEEELDKMIEKIKENLEVD